jgi:2-aminoadipate transaminase
MNDPDVISFAGGAPSPQTFPADAIAEVAARVIRESRNVTLQYGPTRGLQPLREAVVAISRARGIDCSLDDALVTTGSQQALDLVARVLLDPGDVVMVELPTYIGATSSFYAARARLVGVAQDDEGIVPESLEATARSLCDEGARVKLLYVIPNFQNPSGRVMTQARRARVLELAEQYGFLVIEDDPYGELVFVDGVDTRPMKRGDREGRVIYLGSFSKVLAPGLRCGWIVAAPQLATKLEQAKEAADLCSGMLDQSVVAAFVAAGELPAQIARVRAFYSDRREVLLDALKAHFAKHAVWTDAKGGLFTFLTLHADVDTGELIRRAIGEGVAYVPGGPFFVDGSGRNTMRLTFAKEPDDRMRTGVARLAKIFAQ